LRPGLAEAEDGQGPETSGPEALPVEPEDPVDPPRPPVPPSPPSPAVTVLFAINVFFSVIVLPLAMNNPPPEALPPLPPLLPVAFLALTLLPLPPLPAWA